jgi:hypothetical protein
MPSKYGGRYQKILPPSPEQAPAGPHMPGDPRHSSQRPGGASGVVPGAYRGLVASDCKPALVGDRQKSNAANRSTTIVR